MKFSFNGTAWVPTAFDLESKSPPFEPTSHLLWADGGELRAAATKKDMVLEDQPLRLDGVSLGANVRSQNIEGAIEVGVRFQVNGNIRLESEKLRKLAQTVGAEQVRLLGGTDPPVAATLFEKDGWTALVNEESLKLLFQYAALPSTGTSTVPLPVRWLWLGACRSYFVLDNQNHAIGFPVGLVPGFRDRPVGITLEERAPVGACMHVDGEVWSLSPHVVEDEDLNTLEEVAYLFTDSQQTPIHLAAAIKRLKHSVRFSAPGFSEARLNPAPPIPVMERYQAIDWKGEIIGSVVLIEGQRAWDYGPTQFVFPGPESGASMAVFEMEPSPRSRSVEGICVGKLPIAKPVTPSTYLTFREPGFYGIYVQVTDIPKGKWGATSGLRIGEREVLLSWRGFVDRVSVAQLDCGDALRHAVLFKNGFRLHKERWFAAPFAGIAMDARGGWWASLAAVAASIARGSSNDWVISGEWMQVDPKGLSAARRSACEVPLGSQPVLVALTGADTNSAAPILEIGPEPVPRLAGWLADASHRIVFSPGTFRVGDSEWEPEYLLPVDDSPCNLPAEIRSAFEAADASPNVSSGRLGDVVWTRLLIDQKQVIRLWTDASTSGVCRLSEAN